MQLGGVFFCALGEARWCESACSWQGYVRGETAAWNGARCAHRAERDVAVHVAQHGAGMPMPDWARLLRCTECGERDADFGVSGAA